MYSCGASTHVHKQDDDFPTVDNLGVFVPTEVHCTRLAKYSKRLNAPSPFLCTRFQHQVSDPMPAGRCGNVRLHTQPGYSGDVLLPPLDVLRDIHRLVHREHDLW